MSVLAALVALSLTPVVRPALAPPPAQVPGPSWDAGFFLGGLEGVGGALATYDDGSGPALYAGGSFYVSDAIANNLARWNGQAWSAVGTGFTSAVHALEVHDDGSGPALYAGGAFQASMAGQTLMHVARWDGASWSALGSGLHGGFNPAVHALKSFRLDGIPRLFAGGQFTSAGVRRALDVACWSDVRRRRAR